MVNETHFKCIAGALNVSLDVWNDTHELFDVYLPCPCDVSCNETSRPTVSVARTKHGTFVLMEEQQHKATRNKKERPIYMYVYYFAKTFDL